MKFYTAEPNNLKEELTRYFYFLQLRNDLRSGRLQCPQESIASELCALILQEELGKIKFKLTFILSIHNHSRKKL